MAIDGSNGRRMRLFQKAGALLLCVWYAQPGAQTAPLVDVPAEHLPSEKIGTAPPKSRLDEIDRAVRAYGVRADFERDVIYRECVLSGIDNSDEATGEFAVVTYHRPWIIGGLKEGVEVWVNRRTGTFVVIPNQLIREAQVLATKAGMDLTRYSRAVEKIRDRFYITYERRPVKPGRLVVGGAFTLVMTPLGKQVGPILHQY